VAFASIAKNLGDGDAGFVKDIFLRDLQTGAITLLSRPDGTTGTEKGDDDSDRPSISADGHYLAFQSSAKTLGDGDTDGTQDVFVRDTQANTTRLVSRVNGTKGNGNSYLPAISANGRYVAFVSIADNLGGGDGDTISDVFVRDLETGAIRLVSRPSGTGPEKGNAASSSPAISADGRYVAFYSTATNLDGDTDALSDIFVRDMESNTTRLVSRPSGTGPDNLNGHSFAPAISADGRQVAFDSLASNVGDGDADTKRDVFVRDLEANTTRLVSRPTGVGPDKGNGGSGAPAISADGRHVAFQSAATNLGDGDADTKTDVFVRDLEANTTRLVSRPSGPGAEKGDGESIEAAVSATGRFVAFESAAKNLGDGDDNVIEDVFVRDQRGAAVPAVRTGNLLVNGGAEQGTAETQNAVSPDPPGWTRTGNLSEHQYNTPGGWPSSGEGARFGGGGAFFAGGPNGGGGSTTISQTVDLAGHAEAMDTGTYSLTLAAELGGFSRDPDNASLTAKPLSATGAELGPPIAIGPVTPGDRLGFTGFDHREATVPAPVGTRSVAVTLLVDGSTGQYRDGYADNLTLTLDAPPPPPPPTPGPGPGPGSGGLLDKIAPRFAGSPTASPSTFAVSPKARGETAVAARARLGTKLKYSLSEPARVVFTVERIGRGRKRGKRCVKATKANRKKRACTRYTRFGRFAQGGAAGSNTKAFAGKIGRKKMRPGKYRITLRATDAAGNKSRPKSLRVRVVKR
jgi:Tol biopolymer transport system component